MLLLDGCSEYERTYGKDGKPQEESSIRAMLEAQGTGDQGKLTDMVKGIAATCEVQDKTVWRPAYVEGAQDAADFAKKVCNKRSPSGSFFSLGNPGLW
jgi:hypothetical protein